MAIKTSYKTSLVQITVTLLEKASDRAQIS